MGQNRVRLPEVSGVSVTESAEGSPSTMHMTLNITEPTDSRSVQNAVEELMGRWSRSKADAINVKIPVDTLSPETEEVLHNAFKNKGFQLDPYAQGNMVASRSPQTEHR